MRLFGKADGQIDRFDRAWLLTIPFDMPLGDGQAILDAVDLYFRTDLGEPEDYLRTASVDSLLMRVLAEPQTLSRRLGEVLTYSRPLDFEQQLRRALADVITLARRVGSEPSIMLRTEAAAATLSRPTEAAASYSRPAQTATASYRRT